MIAIVVIMIIVLFLAIVLAAIVLVLKEQNDTLQIKADRFEELYFQELKDNIEV